MLSVFILFILEYFLYCDLFASPSMDPKVNHSERAFSSHSFNLVLRKHAVAFGLLLDRNAPFMNLIRLCLHMLVQRQRSVLINLEIIPLRL